MFFRILGLGLLVGFIGVTVIYNQEIMNYSQAIVMERECSKEIDAGHWTGVIDRYEQALKQSPQNIPLALKLAVFYQQDRQFAKAEFIYRQVLKYQPNNVDALRGLGEALTEIPKKRKDAVKALKHALKLRPHNSLILNDLGNLYKKAGENPDEPRQKMQNWFYEWACYYYRQALQTDPNLYQSRFNLGVVYQRLSQPEKAALQYCHTLMKFPDSFETRYNLGLALVEMNYLEDGFRQLSQSIQLLAENDRVQDAQSLAEQVQNLKNVAYNKSDTQLTEKTDAAKTSPPDWMLRCTKSPETKQSP